MLDSNAVTRQSAAGVIIVHDGYDWKDRPSFAIHISDGSDIQAGSAYTLEYLAVAVALRLQGEGI